MLHRSRNIRQCFTALLLSSALGSAMAGIPLTYYNTADETNATTLRDSLKSITTAGFIRVGYSNTNPALYITDEDPNNSSNVIMLYGGDSRAKTLSSGPNNSNPVTGGWNREHTFPQSFFDQVEPLRSDIHALFPCDADINTTRSNSPYGIVGSPSYTDFFGNRATSSLFEPTDSSKGIVARATFYMDIRYDGTGGEPDLTIVNTPPGGTGAGEMAYLNTLLTWHINHPPTAFERARNQKVYNRQRNANPFIDRPEWVADIYGGAAWSVTNGDTLTVAGINRAPGATQAPGAADVPMLTLNLTLADNEFHIGSLTVTETGTVIDSEIANLKLWYDVDRDGIATISDQLLGTTTLSGGSATFTLGPSFYVAPGSTHLLLTATIGNSLAEARTFALSVDPAAITHSTNGGVDINPTGSAINSGTANLGANVTSGDTLTGITSTNLAPLNANAGQSDIRMLSFNATLAANEWDLSSVNLSLLGTAVDSDIVSIDIYRDSNSNNIVDGGEPKVATGTFSGGAATISPVSPYRLDPGTTRFIITANVAQTATVNNTFGVRVNANGLISAISGGTDTNPTFANLDSGLAAITSPESATNATVIISEVYEGNGVNLKYIELYNTTNAPINLSTPKQYRLRRYANGSYTSTNINLTGTIPANGFYLIANNATDYNAAFSNPVPFPTPDQFSGNISHNGNDAYDLYIVSDDLVIDSFAGDLLGTSTNFAVDVVAIRRFNELPNSGSWGGAVQPATDSDSPSGFWATFAITASNGNATAVGSPGLLDAQVNSVDDWLLLID